MEGFVAVLIVGTLAALGGRWLSKKFPPATANETRMPKTSDDARLYRWLYGATFALLFAAAPLAVLIATNALGRFSLRWSVLGIGVLASLGVFVPLLVARLKGREEYFAFWNYIEQHSKIRRTALVVVVASVLGIAVLAFVLLPN